MERDGATVVIDAVRNPLSGGALAAALDHFPARRRTFVGVPGVLRRDADLEDLGRILGATFDRIVLCGSEPATQEADAVAATRIVDALQPSAGSLRTPLRRGASSGGRVVEIVVVPGQREAVEAALDALEVGDLLVLQADEFHPGSTVDQVREWMVRHA
jgi:cyanophycin synthetase